VHIGGSNHISMTNETAIPALPRSALGLLMMAAFRTPAGGSPLRSGEALDASRFSFMTQV